MAVAVAVVTGASRGLGRALARGLADRGWSVVVDGRDPEALAASMRSIERTAAEGARVVAVPGDVADPDHRRDLIETARRMGGIDLLVNNASELGPSPQPRLAAYPLGVLRQVYEVNVLAPLALVQAALPLLRSSERALVVNVTSDASVEAYEGWGGYGSSKAALDHLSAIVAIEEPGVTVLAIDPGDMRTQMHQAAFPGEDISDRPLPESAVPAFLALIDGVRVDGTTASGRYRLSDIHDAAGVAP